jgi:CheY-like chemotaxis protein
MDGRIDAGTELVALVRDGLQHLFDPAYLQTHALAAFTDAAPGDRIARGRLVRQALLDAIQALHPGSSVTAASHAWRAYRILELRYVAGHEVGDVAVQLALSKRQYHREHHRAIEAVASVLRERGPAPGSPPGRAAVGGANGGAELTRLEAQRLVDEDGAQSVDVVEVLRGVRDLVQPLCTQLGATLRLEVPSHPLAVAGERVALRQALLTCITHALQAARGAQLCARIDRRESSVDIGVSTPPGVDTERLRLGVRECQPFVGALGGTIELRARPDSSAELRLRLRAADRPILLVVDNNPEFVRLVERYMTGYDWQIVGAGDVEHALALARQRRPWAILLDAVIPGRDGWELLLELKRDRGTREIPVVLCSVLDEPELALSLGAAGYLHKPIDQGQLVGALSRFR